MNPKEKAKELYDKMLQWQTDGNIYIQRNITSPSAKHSALIAVEEMLDFRNSLYINEGSLAHQYLIEVKQEIEKL